MRIFIPIFIAFSSVTAGAFAEPQLAPGKPAGVLPAQNMKTTELYLFGIAGLVALGTGYLLSRNNGTSAAATSTMP